jgi:hypothetical protein
MNYSKTKIYKIYSHIGDKIYIGSTTNDYLSNRMAKHRYNYTYWKNGKGSHIRSYDLFDLYGIENCIIELLEAKECINKDDKNKLEGEYIRKLECINKNITGRTDKEYREDNKEILINKHRKYNEDNKEIIRMKAKIYDDTHKEEKKLRNKRYNDKMKAVREARMKKM